MTVEELHGVITERFDRLEGSLVDHQKDDTSQFRAHRDEIEAIKRRLAYLAGAAGVVMFIIEPVIHRLTGGSP